MPKIIVATLLTPLVIYWCAHNFVPGALIGCFVLLDLLIALQTKKRSARCGSCGHRWTLPEPFANLRRARRQA